VTTVDFKGDTSVGVNRQAAWFGSGKSRVGLVASGLAFLLLLLFLNGQGLLVDEVCRMIGAGDAPGEPHVRILEWVGIGLVVEVLFDGENERHPEKHVVAQPVVDQLVCVLVGQDHAHLVKGQIDHQVIVHEAVFQSLAHGLAVLHQVGVGVDRGRSAAVLTSGGLLLLLPVVLFVEEPFVSGGRRRRDELALQPLPLVGAEGDFDNSGLFVRQIPELGRLANDNHAHFVLITVFHHFLEVDLDVVARQGHLERRYVTAAAAT